MSNASAVMYEKGPVRVVEMFGAWCVRNTSGVVAQCLSPGLENGKEVAAANARRIAATWNACEGIPTEALESGVVQEMMEAFAVLVRQASYANHLILEVCGPTNTSILEQCLERAKNVLAKARGEAS